MTLFHALYEGLLMWRLRKLWPDAVLQPHTDMDKPMTVVLSWYVWRDDDRAEHSTASGFICDERPTPVQAIREAIRVARGET